LNAAVANRRGGFERSWPVLRGTATIASAFVSTDGDGRAVIRNDERLRVRGAVEDVSA
jgi:hypothetical protein